MQDPPSAIVPELVDAGGRLPPFWDESVLFVANLLALFFGNEEETELLRAEVQGADTYGGRLVPILNLLFRGTRNQLLLERPPNPALIDYFGNELGLGLPEIQIVSHQEYLELGRRLAEGQTPDATALFRTNGATVMDGYVTDDTLSTLARHVGLPTVSPREGSHRGNNKYLLHLALESAGLPLFDTFFAESSAEVPERLRRLRELGYRSGAVKSQLGASGIGILKLPTEAGSAEAAGVPDMMFHEGPCLVQGWLEAGLQDITSISSPSVQLFLDHEHVFFYDVTEQLLRDDSVHQGNESPPPYLDGQSGLREELLRQAGIAGRWLHEQGYRGTASVDFLVAHRQEGGAPTVYVCEINARVTGATYPSVLARHFRPGGAWLMRNLRFASPLAGPALLARLRGADLLFRPDQSGGILPINFNTGADGMVVKGQFLCLASSPPDCPAMLQAAGETLGVSWQQERD
ncbi:MAG TPA: hypothetical protein DCY13_15445 [Verrucomicrobiales bacterium]|nr:hypothetical protein [Verrucomicrobiales bacterium]